jgi:hypothetical protein
MPCAHREQCVGFYLILRSKNTECQSALTFVRRGSGERLWPCQPHCLGFPDTLPKSRRTSCAVAETLTLFDLRLDGLSRESARGMAQKLEGELVKPGEAPPLEIRTGQRLYALQPGGKRRGLR